MARYAIVNKESVIVPEDVNTTPSRYSVMSWKPYRKAKSRDMARQVKKSFKNPRQYAIVDTQTKEIVR